MLEIFIGDTWDSTGFHIFDIITLFLLKLSFYGKYSWNY